MSKRKVEVKAGTPVAIRQTKKSQVLEMLNGGAVSVMEIADKLSISKQAAYSLIGDVKRGGAAISGVMKDGAMRYSVVQPKRAKAKTLAFGKGPVVSDAPSTPTVAD
ncbi:HTH domain-containing protein [Mesorhizobium sp. M7A.F.Ca.US.008.03.1.1]|uniref:HTH domain-containing protein n=1 Tax=Mesorhizobium sp. M7A.F.Ca.US.008.03.1.1 TaxID=2496742 RepID=UPI000FCC0B0D|nr:HTH domain-containing protein [Mesorhizobium sp. M7A.F.Ca.US.008.03.1.1]RUW58359.1 HTH domain-containing protein [Mesorhizobium sp. M7A.F.Ca.US.008.03.1.1]